MKSATNETPGAGQSMVRLLLTAREAAAACGKSLRTWRTWDASGLIPRPMRVGRNTLWRLDELERWIKAGCPNRTTWEVMTDDLGQEENR
jgi:prophage regulatory protein